MQTRYWNFDADDATKDINRWMTGVITSGLYYGFDFSPSANLNLNLIHTGTGFKDVDNTPAESGFQSLIVSRQGVVVKENAAIVINGVGAGHATLPRIDVIVMSHAINEISGGAQALYSIIPGAPNAVPVAPALTDIARQVKIGELYIPATTADLTNPGITWTRFSKNGLGLGFSASVAIVTNAMGQPVSSGLSVTELNRLIGVTSPVQTQLNTLSARNLIAGSGLAGGGNLTADRTFDVNVDNSTIEINSNTIRVKAGGLTNSHLAAGVAVANLGFTPPPNTRNLTAGSGLAGGGDLSADRTFDVNVDNSSIEINSDTLRVKAAGIVGAMIANVTIDDTKVDASIFKHTHGVPDCNNILTGSIVSVQGSTVANCPDATAGHTFLVFMTEQGISNAKKTQTAIQMKGTGIGTWWTREFDFFTGWGAWAIINNP